jgi:hypothetical protein
MKSIILTLVVLTGSLSHAALAKYSKKMLNGQTVTFLKDAAMTPEDFSRADFRLKPDQAYLQNNFPLSDQEKNAITREDIQKMTQEEIDQLYIRLEAGPIIPGKYMGSVVQVGELIKDIKKDAYSKIAGQFPGIGTIVKLMCSDRDAIECLAEKIWSGKHIYSPDGDGVYMLRNAIDPAVYTTVQTAMGKPTNTAKQFFSGITDFLGITKNVAADLEQFPADVFLKSLIPKAMIFPAHVYCGQSLLDHRRESVIIDYAHGDDFTPFNPDVDVLAGPGYLDIRDEIRMVHPGLYLGRAYTNKIFLLNFILKNSEPVGVVASTCFDGKSTR